MIDKRLELDVIIAQMAKNCAFSLGKKHLENIEPSFNKLVIKRDINRMKEALMMCIKYGEMPFNGFKDIKVVLENILKDRLITSNDCLNIIAHFSGVKSINLYFNEHKNDYPNLDELVSSLHYNQKLVDYLNNIFNEYGEIKDRASNELLNIRNKIKKVDGDIAVVSEKFKKDFAGKLVDGIITTRNNRVVVLVKASDKNTFGGFVHGESSSGQAAYVEPSVFFELNNKKINLQFKEEEEIEKILWECCQEIKKDANLILYNLNTVAILDSFFARAIWGKENDATTANLVYEQKIILNKARHPLIDKKQVISNTYRIKEPYRVLLITGPNTGGKTVSLKIIGLMVLMTYCGMPITVDNAEIPFFDKLFIDIGDEQSVVSSLSTFSAHLSKLADVCENATANSLVLLDELGSGTDPKEGESLAIAVLNELRNRKCMIVATTHYGRLKTYGKKHDDILVAMVQFDIEKLLPTYKFIEGLTGQSNAFDIARRYGLSESIIKNAKFLKEQGKSNEDELLEKLEKQLVENQILNQSLNEKLSNVAIKEKEWETLTKQLHDKKEKLLEEAKMEVELYLEEKKEEADNILKQLRDFQNQNIKYHEALNISKKLTIKESKEEADLKEDFNIGDTVMIKSSNQIGTVLSMHKKQVIVDVRGINVIVKKHNLKYIEKTISNEKPKKTAVNTIKISEAKFECYLIGKTVSEAIPVLDKFIDNAKVSKMPMVRIIHGDGSGVLRKAVHDYLSKDKTIKEYRLGMPSEGSTGATIVIFR